MMNKSLLLSSDPYTRPASAIVLVVRIDAGGRRPGAAGTTAIETAASGRPTLRLSGSLARAWQKRSSEDLSPCAVNEPGMNIRKNPVGEILAQDGTQFTVPTANNFQAGP